MRVSCTQASTTLHAQRHGLEFGPNRRGESKKHYEKGKAAVALYEKLRSISGRLTPAGVEAWIVSREGALDYQRRLSRRLETELLVALGEKRGPA